MQDFIFWDISPRRTNSAKMGKNEIALNNKKGNYSMTFNQETSKELIEKGFKRIKIAENPYTSEIFIVANKTETDGIAIHQTGREESKNAICSNMELIKRLYESLKIEGNVKRSIVNISGNKCNTEDFYVMKISNLKQTKL